MSKSKQTTYTAVATAVMLVIWFIVIQAMIFIAGEVGANQFIAYLHAVQPYFLLGLLGLYWLIFTIVFNQYARNKQ